MWVEVEHIHNGAENPKDVDVLAYISDISDEMAAHEALHRREQLFSRLAESLPSGVLQLHQDRSVAYANARLTTILEVAEPTTAAEVLSIVVDHDRPAVDAALDAALDRGEDHQLEVEILRPRTADRRRCALTFAAVCDHEGRAGAPHADSLEDRSLRALRSRPRSASGPRSIRPRPVNRIDTTINYRAL